MHSGLIDIGCASRRVHHFVSRDLHEQPQTYGSQHVKVSIAIPTYNGADFIEATLASVFEQSFGDFDVVVSDDGSTDGTIQIVESFDDSRLRIVEDRSHLGAEGNWNRALAHAQAPYIKILPQDDLMFRDNLATEVDALEASVGSSFVAVRRDIVGADGVVLVKDRGLAGLCGAVDLVEGSRRIVRAGGNQFGEGAAVLFRRTAADAVGGFDGSLPYAIDINYWLRLLAWGPALGICETHAAFRVSSQAWSNALVREQGQQFVALIDRLATDQQRGITQGDVLVGKARARTNAFLRRAFYLRYRSHL